MRINEIINEEFPWKSTKSALSDLPLVGKLFKSEPESYYKNDYRKGPVTDIEGNPVKGSPHDQQQVDLGHFASDLQQIGPKAAKYYDGIDELPAKPRTIGKSPTIKIPDKGNPDPYMQNAWQEYNHPLFKYTNPKRKKQIMRRLKNILPAITPQLKPFDTTGQKSDTVQLGPGPEDLESLLKSKRKI
tara:strand:- start:317 stop:877 length:561 start_codon:yes stop_codon:yes gene_type:complete